MDFPEGGAAADLDVAWIHGSEAARYNTDPGIQVHTTDEHTGWCRQRPGRYVLAQMIITPAG